jgi:hypothetical protein
MASNEMGMAERVAAAIDKADIGFNMRLVRLVDDERTYTLTYDGEPPLEFDNTEDLYAHVAARKYEAKARAAIEAMRIPTEEMLQAQRDGLSREFGMTMTGGYLRRIHERIIDAALSHDEVKG